MYALQNASKQQQMKGKQLEIAKIHVFILDAYVCAHSNDFHYCER